MDENAISKVVLDAAFKVHCKLGPGLLESVYEVVLARELSKQGFAVMRQQPVEIRYEDMMFEESFRADLVVNGILIVEIKSVEKVLPLHPKQLLTYLRLTGLKLGLLINFN